MEIIENTDKTGLGIANNIYDTVDRNYLNSDFIALFYDFVSSIFSNSMELKENFKNFPITIYYIFHVMCTFIEHGRNTSIIIINLIDNLVSIYIIFFFAARTK